MQFEVHNHHDAKIVVPNSFQKKVLETLESTPARKPISTQKIRTYILRKLHDDGWSDEIRVAPALSKIDITSMKSNIGLCIQTGNMSRFYADILKLQTLFAEKRIKGSICIVPKRTFAKVLGQNIVNYERLVREITIFQKIITVPILIYGIEE